MVSWGEPSYHHIKARFLIWGLRIRAWRQHFGTLTTLNNPIVVLKKIWLLSWCLFCRSLTSLKHVRIWKPDCQTATEIQLSLAGYQYSLQSSRVSGHLVMGSTGSSVILVSLFGCLIWEINPWMVSGVGKHYFWSLHASWVHQWDVGVRPVLLVMVFTQVTSPDDLETSSFAFGGAMYLILPTGYEHFKQWQALFFLI